MNADAIRASPILMGIKSSRRISAERWNPDLWTLSVYDVNSEEHLQETPLQDADWCLLRSLLGLSDEWPTGGYPLLAYQLKRVSGLLVDDVEPYREDREYILEAVMKV